MGGHLLSTSQECLLLSLEVLQSVVEGVYVGLSVFQHLLHTSKTRCVFSSMTCLLQGMECQNVRSPQICFQGEEDKF